MTESYPEALNTAKRDGAMEISPPHIHPQTLTGRPNILKATTSLELGHDIPVLGIATFTQRRNSKEKSHTGHTMLAEAPGKVSYSAKSTRRERFPSLNDIAGGIGSLEIRQRNEVPRSRISLIGLPDEVQQQILGYLMGDLGSLSSKSSGTGVKNWHYALRHSRAREQASLALVTRKWRIFIQQRLFRHIRIQGTRQSMNDCYLWFLTHPHLRSYVRHVDFWIPVWEKRPLAFIPIPSRFEELHQAGTTPISSHYQLASDVATVEEIFNLIRLTFDEACVLTLHGGTCKKPPQVPISRKGNVLPQLPNIKTLILQGAWTLIREIKDFEHFSKALPNLRDWQCMFAIPKYKAYKAMNELVPSISSRLTHLQLCMDGFYSTKRINPFRLDELRENHHLCSSLGTLLPQLEALTFSGRACYCLFSAAMDPCARKASDVPRLKSLDLALRNCCRDRNSQFGEGSGMYNWAFIAAFEKLVVEATASLTIFTNLTSIRIRFVDFDSPMAYLNPYFQLKDNTAYGIYNETILNNLNSLDRSVSLAYDEEMTDFENHKFSLGRRTIGRRPNRIHVSEYASISLNQI